MPVVKALMATSLAPWTIILQPARQLSGPRRQCSAAVELSAAAPDTAAGCLCLQHTKVPWTIILQPERQLAGPRLPDAPAGCLRAHARSKVSPGQVAPAASHCSACVPICAPAGLPGCGTLACAADQLNRRHWPAARHILQPSGRWPDRPGVHLSCPWRVAPWKSWAAFAKAATTPLLASRLMTMLSTPTSGRMPCADISSSVCVRQQARQGAGCQGAEDAWLVGLAHSATGTGTCSKLHFQDAGRLYREARVHRGAAQAQAKDMQLPNTKPIGTQLAA